jgi:F-type H+-transporting ATPase subunit gamma
MESISAIKLRLHSISSTQQITKSMQMISTTKVQKTLRRMQQNAPYLEHTQNLLRGVVRFSGGCHHTYLSPPSEAGGALVIAISSDRGLCGAYNVNVCREAATQLNQMSGGAQCITIGEKIREYLRRRKFTISHAFDGASESPAYEGARDIANMALDMYRSGEASSVTIIYTRYESALLHTPTTTQLLPVAFAGDAGDPHGRAMNFEPGIDEILDHVVPLYVSASVFGAMLNSASCEQSARIMSMDAAAKNCGDMIESLSLKYNRLRQSTITQELSEIVSGAQALQGTEEG